MPQTLNPTITAAGLAAAVSASQGGIFLALTHITLGAGKYTPAVNANGEATQTDLLSRREKITFGGGRPTGPKQVTFGATFPVFSGVPYEVGEIGIWSGDPDNGGILFAVYSRPDYIHAYRNDQTGLVESYSFTLNRVPDNSVTVTVDPNSTALNSLIEEHERKPDPHPQYFLRSEVAALRTSILQMAYPVGSVYVSYLSTSPSALFGFGVWQLTAIGRAFFGVDSANPQLDAPGKQFGAPDVALSVDNLPEHSHFVANTDDAPNSPVGAGNTVARTDNNGGDLDYQLSGTATPATVGRSSSVGSALPVNIYPPGEAVYKWRRMPDAVGNLGPAPFGFASTFNAPLNSVTTSSPTTLSGMQGPSPISVTGGSYNINGGAFTTAPGTVANGDVVRARLTTGATYQASQTVTVTVNAVSGTWTVTTEASPTADTTPNAFSFTPVANAPQSTMVTSNAITVSGINAPATISVTGGSYSVNGGPFTTATGQVSNGASVRAQVTSAPAANTARTATVTIGGVSASFQVTTTATGVSVTASPSSSNLSADTAGGPRTLNSNIALTINGGTGPYTTTVALINDESGTASNITRTVLSPTSVRFTSTAGSEQFFRGTFRITVTAASGGSGFVDVSISHTYTNSSIPTQ